MFRQGWYQHWFARCMAQSDPYQDRIYGERKKELFAGMSGYVLEIGAGTGVNLPYLPEPVKWVGIDPNLQMHRYVQEKAARVGIPTQLVTGIVESLPFSDDHFDAVISTLVLCSVKNQAVALREIKRVLKPQGVFYFIEHVGAPKGTMLRGIQKTISPLWQLVADGCCPNRDTESTIHEAGFSQLDLSTFKLSTPMSIIAPHIIGTAVK